MPACVNSLLNAADKSQSGPLLLPGVRRASLHVPRLKARTSSATYCQGCRDAEGPSCKAAPHASSAPAQRQVCRAHAAAGLAAQIHRQLAGRLARCIRNRVTGQLPCAFYGNASLV
eukprot:77444-Chlamydomonas_euryale.AAC.4